VYIILTKNKEATDWAQKYGNTVIQHKNGFYIIIPKTDSEAHRIYNKYGGIILNIEKELYCTVCAKDECNEVYIHSDAEDVPPCLYIY